MRSKKINEETKQFDADITQLMNLIINSFYSKSEIFLRELLSNASDALEKVRYESLTDTKLLDSNIELKVKVWVEDGKLIIEDTGIGMTKNDLIKNLGTIANSGTREFLENAKLKHGEFDQIGQFGVGFYSAFLVADKVEIYTKNDNDMEYIWVSSAKKSYTIKENKKPILKRGTKLILYIKEDDDEYLDIDTVKDIINKYTQYINYPIEIFETIKHIDDEGNEIIEGDKWTVINKNKPIWSRKPNEVKNEEYINFYKNITEDSEPLAYKHFHAEGHYEFECLLYIPDKTPSDMFDQSKKKKSVKLYVKRIFIMDDCEDLVPEWLKFMRGIVDSNDIQLNVSRELLQQSHIVKQIGKIIVKRSIELFNQLAEDKEKYEIFYDTYNKMLKLGVHEDKRNRDKLAKLLRFYSVNYRDNYISLDDYINNMKNGQENIYFITGQSINSLSSSPFIEKLKEEGNDILYFIDPIDEYMIQNLKQYEKYNLVDVSKEEIEFDERMGKINKDLIEYLKKSLEGKVHDVKISKRLMDTPCVLVTTNQGWSANMERIVKAQALRNNEMDHFMVSKKILEINLSHNVILKLAGKVEIGDIDEESDKIVNMLYNTAQINCGFILDDPSEFAKKINIMIEENFCY